MMYKTVACIFVAGAVSAATGSINLPTQAQNTLTTIDSVPTRAQLDSAFEGSPTTALQNLAVLAGDDTEDVGIRLRAIHALAKYCAASPCTTSDLAHQAVRSLLAATRDEQIGSAVLLLRAGIETLGDMGVTSDATVLVPLLDHVSRDIRTATARALRDLCNPQAVTPLRVRYAKEPTEQVKLAISEALRILDQCASN